MNQTSEQATLAALKVKAEALRYASNGWRVIPVHNPTIKGCSCGNASCTAIGKHPRIADWIHKATTDASIIGEWLDTWPMTNIGVVFGVHTGLIDIETDVKHNGERNLTRLMKTIGTLQLTAMFRSGSGGIHRLFKCPAGYRIRTRSNLGSQELNLQFTGIDIRAEGGQSVMPPSLHVSGNRYEWIAATSLVSDQDPLL